MSRRTSVPHLHNDMVADFVRDVIWAQEFSQVGFATTGSGDFTPAARSNFYKTVGSAYETRMFDTVGGFCATNWFMPDRFDVGSRMRFRVLWHTSETTGSQTATWAVTYSNIAEGTAVADATTALNTVIAADTDDTDARGLNFTAWGILNGQSLTHDRMLNLRVELDALNGLAVATDRIHFVGLQVEGTPRFLS